MTSVLPNSKRWSNFLGFTPLSFNTLSTTARVPDPDSRQISGRASRARTDFNPSIARRSFGSGIRGAHTGTISSGHELPQGHPWTTLTALDQPKPHALLSKLIARVFGVMNDQVNNRE